jgi:periplasmic protein TonB
VNLSYSTKLDNDIDQVVNEEYDSLDEDSVAELRSSQPELGDSPNDKALRYCVIASVVLHIAFFASLPILAGFAPAKPFMNTGDQVTPVRLVEFNSEKKQEPPPEVASAISDRDHTAERQRLPKALPDPRPPLGSVESNPQRLAALPPPVAPEDFVKPEEEKTERTDHPTPAQKPVKKPSNSKEPIHPRAKKSDLTDRHIDLRPTPAEIAKGLSSSGGATQFYPEGTPDEPVVDINTREVTFFSYLQHLKQKIQAVWIYPTVAARSGIGGSLMLEFLISKEGQLLGVNLLDSSGHTVLDESAMRAIKSAAPFYPFPPRLKAKRIRIRANFIYITGNSFRNFM